MIIIIYSIIYQPFTEETSPLLNIRIKNDVCTYVILMSLFMENV